MPKIAVFRRWSRAGWEPTEIEIDSPRPDGSVAYYMDSLSPAPTVPGIEFDDETASVLCNRLVSTAAERSLQVADGPYLQVLELAPPRHVMIRALVWVEEFDLLVPMDTAQAVSDG